MTKRILSFVMVMVLLVQLIPLPSQAYPAPEFGAQNATQKFRDSIPVSVAHRAAWRDAPECSILAVYNAIKMGIDVFELDIQLSKDGKLVLFHDSSVDRTVESNTGSAGNFTLTELRDMNLEKNQGNSSAHVLTEAEAQILNSVSSYVADCGESQAGDKIHVNTLEDVLELMKENAPNTMINLDKCTSQERFVATYILLREYDMVGNVFIKSSKDAVTMANWYAAAAAAWNEKHPESTITADEVKNSVLYVYVLSEASTNAIAGHLTNNGNLVMVEICIDNDTEDAQMLEIVEPWCKENNVAMFINTMWAGLCSTKEDTETTWAEMLDRGYAAIQTDHPSELAEYLQACNNGHKATDTIEAEHFHMFNYENYGLHVAEVADNNMNKKVTGIQNGDWLRYEKITFQGGENAITLNMSGAGGGGALSVYLDDAVEPIAVLMLSENAAYTNTTVVLRDAVEAGTHTITLKASGIPGTALLGIDYFTFDTLNLSGSHSYEAVAVFTEVGIAPVLPNTVNLVLDELSIALDVSWEAIPASGYGQTGTFKVLGFVEALGEYVEATVTVRTIEPAVAQENLVAWFDASEGVTVSDGTVSQWRSQAGDLTATVESGAPILVDNAISGEAGIHFDGNDVFLFSLEEEFWNKTNAQFTVLMYVSSECVTSGNGTTTSGASVNRGNQETSVLWFAEKPDAWGGAYFEASQNEVIWRYGSGVTNDRGTTYVRSSPVGEAFTAAAIRKDGSTDTLFVDGTRVYTYTAKSPDTQGTNSVGRIGRGVNTFFKGTVCQILIYDAALTNEQIIAAQRWMAQKYADRVVSAQVEDVTTTAGMAPVMPKTVTATYESGATVELAVKWENITPQSYQNSGTFTVKGKLPDETDVTATVNVLGAPGTSIEKWDSVLLWLSAKSLSGTGAVSQWTAKNNENLNFVQTTAANQPTIVTNNQGEIVGVKFDGTNDVLTLAATNLTDANNPLAQINGLPGATVVVYSKPENTAAEAVTVNHYSSLLYMDESGDWGSLYFGTFTNGARGRLGTGTAKYRGFAYTKGSYNDYYTAVLRKNGTGVDELIIDNQNISVSDMAVDGATSGSTVKNIKATNVKLGQGKVKNNDYTMWKGTVSEIMVFNKSLTDAELRDVYAYLAETYGATYDTEATDVYLEQEGVIVELVVGEQTQLNASVVPGNATNQTITFESSNTDVATVDAAGMVTAVGTGYATITVTTDEGNHTASCTIKVNENRLWTSIVNIRRWAAAQDKTVYANFSVMEEALEQTKDVTAATDNQTLETAYNTLRAAMLSLNLAMTPVIENNTGDTGAAILTAPVAGWTEGTNTFMVSCSDACIVAVSNDNGATYTRLAAAETETEGTYSFTAEHVNADTKIAIIKVGDANGDGTCDAADMGRIKDYRLGNVTLSALELLAADANGDGECDAADIGRIKGFILGKVAENESNNKGVEFFASLSNSTIQTSTEDQTVVLTINASPEITLDCIEYVVNYNSELALTGFSTTDANLVYISDDLNLNYGQGQAKVVWNSDSGDNIAGVTNIGQITFTIPANTPAGTYVFSAAGIKISQDYGTKWENTASASATLTIVNENTPDYAASLNCADTDLHVGEQLAVNVAVNGAEDEKFASAEVIVAYDSSKLTFNKNASVLGSAMVCEEVSGIIQLEDYGQTKEFGNVYTLVFDTVASGSAEVKLTSAKFSADASAESDNLVAATLSNTTVAAELTQVYSVSLPDGFTGLDSVTEGADYTFRANDTSNYTYEVTATMGGQNTTVTDNKDGTYTVSGVNGALVIFATSKANSYTVNFAGEGAEDVANMVTTATYKTDYSFTMPANTADYTYSLTSIQYAGGGDVPYTTENGVVTIAGTNITDDFTVTIAKEKVPQTTASITVEGATSDVVYEPTAVVGVAYTFTVKKDDRYEYDVTATVNGEAVTLTPGENGQYSISFVDFEAGDAIKICVAKTEKTTIENPFVDVPEGSYYFDPVLWAVDNGITTGVDNTHFDPDGNCQRAQVVTFLWRAAGSPEPTSTENPFTDVTEGAYYYKAVLWAVENNITNGISTNKFSPFENCTRAQAVTFLWRAQGCPESTAEVTFKDVLPGQFYTDAVVWAVENGITNGMGDGNFGVNITCNRAQLVTILMRHLTA